MNEATRRIVRERADNRCEYCRLPQAADPIEFVIDHVIARKHGGDDSLLNLALACYACNLFKGPNIAGFDHDEAEVVRLFHPRTDCWEDHFRYDGPRIVPRSSIGRVTISVLAINSPDRLAFRDELLREQFTDFGE